MKIKYLLKKYRDEICLAGVALALQLAVRAVLIYRYGWNVDGLDGAGADSIEYFRLIKNLVERHAFAIWTEPRVFLDTLRMPLYPLFGAAIYLVTHRMIAVIFAQQIFAAVSVVLIYRLGRYIFNPRIAFWGTILAFANMQWLRVMAGFGTEPLFFIFVTTSFLYILKFNEKPNYKRIFVSSLMAGLATLTRVFVASLIPVFLFYIVITKFRHREVKWKQILISLILFTVTFGAVVSPWSLRNYKHFGTFNLSSSYAWNLFNRSLRRYFEYKHNIDEYGLFGSNNDLQGQFLKDNHLENTDVPFKVLLRDFKYQDYFVGTGLAIIKHDPIFYAYSMIRRLVPFFIDSDFGLAYPFVKYNLGLQWTFLDRVPFFLIGRIVQIAIYCVIFLYAALSWKAFKPYWWALLFYLPLALAFGFLGGVSFTVRHRMPIDQFVHFLFIFSIIGLWRKGKRIDRSSVIPV